MPTTPWSEYVTQQPELFLMKVEPSAKRIYIIAGDDPDISGVDYCHTEPRQLHVKTSQFPEYQQVLPYKLRLDPWRGLEEPRLFLHPVALLHLIATKQTPMSFVRDAGRVMIEPSTEVELLLVTPCDLLDMLRVDLVIVHFGTNYDVEVK